MTAARRMRAPIRQEPHEFRAWVQQTLVGRPAPPAAATDVPPAPIAGPATTLDDAPDRPADPAAFGIKGVETRHRPRYRLRELRLPPVGRDGLGAAEVGSG